MSLPTSNRHIGPGGSSHGPPDGGPAGAVPPAGFVLEIRLRCALSICANSLEKMAVAANISGSGSTSICGRALRPSQMHGDQEVCHYHRPPDGAVLFQKHIADHSNSQH